MSAALASPDRWSPDGPEWLLARRRGAAERWRREGFPGPKAEAFRFTPVALLTAAAGELLPAPLAATVAGAVPAGVDVWPLLDAPEAVARLLGGVVAAAADRPLAFADLNTACFGEACVVRVRAGASPAGPLELDFAAPEAGGPRLLLPRLLVVVEEGARLTLVERYRGPDGVAYATDAVTEVVLAPGATLEHVRLQEDGGAALHVGALAVQAARDVTYRSHVVSLGGRLSRLDLDVRLDGPGADCELYGLYLADGEAHQDHHTLVDHRAPDAQSRERYRGVVAGAARGVFEGRIKVRPGAQRTSAHQANHNLLLSDGAVVHSKPALEIDADDVKCSHGATVGQLDPDALYYLRSRGIGEAEARGLLLQAFVRDVLDRLPDGALRERVTAAALERLPRGG